MLSRVAEEVVANGIGVPAGPGQQVLDAVGRRVAQMLGELPPVLPLGPAQQAADVPDRPLYTTEPHKKHPPQPGKKAPQGDGDAAE